MEYLVDAPLPETPSRCRVLTATAAARAAAASAARMTRTTATCTTAAAKAAGADGASAKTPSASSEAEPGLVLRLVFVAATRTCCWTPSQSRQTHSVLVALKGCRLVAGIAGADPHAAAAFQATAVAPVEAATRLDSENGAAFPANHAIRHDVAGWTDVPALAACAPATAVPDIAALAAESSRHRRCYSCC